MQYNIKVGDIVVYNDPHLSEYADNIGHVGYSWLTDVMQVVYIDRIVVDIDRVREIAKLKLISGKREPQYYDNTAGSYDWRLRVSSLKFVHPPSIKILVSHALLTKQSLGGLHETSR